MNLDLSDECVGIKPRKNKRSNRYKRSSISLPRILLKGLLRKVGLRADNVYFRDSERSLYGGWATGQRLRGLTDLLSMAHGRSVLDLGCAEGMIAEAFLRSGARLVHGFDVNPRRIAKAQRLVLDTRACFRTGDITKWKKFIKIGHLNNEYDIVLFLSIYRQLKENRMEILRNVIARTGWLLAIRGAQ